MHSMCAIICSEDELSIVRRDPLEVAVQISPYTGEDSRQQYVSASLHLKTPEGYPDTPAEFALNNIKGDPVLCCTFPGMLLPGMPGLTDCHQHAYFYLPYSLPIITSQYTFSA